jgi:hypothetical protein
MNFGVALLILGGAMTGCAPNHSHHYKYMQMAEDSVRASRGDTVAVCRNRVRLSHLYALPFDPVVEEEIKLCSLLPQP